MIFAPLLTFIAGDDKSNFLLMHMFLWIQISKATCQFSDTDVQMMGYAFIDTRCDTFAHCLA